MSASSIARIVAPLLLTAALGACTPTPALWSEADARKEIGVRRIELVHDVAFAAPSADLAPTEVRRLDEFIARQQVGYGDVVEIHTSGRDSRLDTRRAAAVAERLARNGIVAERGAPAGSGVRITVARSVAVPPACPDWRKPDNDGDPSNTPLSNLGCANMRNLGLMIADPSELLVGRGGGAGSGEPLAAGVQRYRAGKVTPLVDSETSGSK
ncbi:MAG: CpaD family pilus assembly lipoprotein [Gemmatimonas sp.]